MHGVLFAFADCVPRTRGRLIGIYLTQIFPVWYIADGLEQRTPWMLSRQAVNRQPTICG
jgi:hypothetical protein